MRGSSQGSRSLLRRIARGVSLLGFAALAAPAVASGDDIYVAPDDESSGFFCDQDQPCALVIGINLVADDNDVVLMAPGIYDTSAELEVPGTATGVTIRPRDPGTRPVINSTATSALQLTAPNGTVRGIEVKRTGGGGTGIFALGSGSAIRNVISTSDGDTPCQLGSATLTDSVCHATGQFTRALRVSVAFGNLTPKVRNATLIADGSNGPGIYVSTQDSMSSVALDIASSIISGSPVDIETDTGGGAGGPITVDASSSNFDTRTLAPGATVTAIGTDGNQTAAPIFANSSYEQAAGSPTIDAGLVDALTGTTDLDGDPRPQGAANDIGADELAVVAPPVTDTTPPDTSITKKPRKRTKSRRAKFSFASTEPGSSFECKLDGGGFQPCAEALKLKKLKRRGHKLEVRATDPAGNTDQTPATASWKVKKKRR